MKGIVVEIKKNYVAVLSDDGVVTKVQNSNYEPGQVIEIRKTRVKRSRLITGAASLAAAFAVCTIGSYAYFTPTDYVSLDVNPSIEYSINMFDRVLDVRGVNDDGEEILKSLYLDNHTIEEAVKLTLSELIKEGYLADDADGGVIVTTSNPDLDEAEKLAKELETEIQSFIDEQKNVTAEVESLAVSRTRVEEAKKLGVTPGKLNLVQKLQSTTDSAIDMEEWLDKPVKEINKTIKENRKSMKESEKDSEYNNTDKDWNNKDLDKDKGKDKNSGKDIEKDKDSDRGKAENKNSDKDKDDNKDRKQYNDKNKQE